MANSEAHSEPLKFGGSMRAGFFNAQLFVELSVTPSTLTLSAGGKSFRIDRDHFQGIEETSILEIFKRGIRFRHSQPALPDPIIFYPSIGREVLRHKLHELAWS